MKAPWPGPVARGTPLLSAVVMMILVTWARGSGIAATPGVLKTIAAVCAAFVISTVLSALRLSAPLAVDPSAGTIRFIRRLSSRSVRKATALVSDVREVVLSSRAVEWYGKPGIGFCMVRLLTGPGGEDLLVTRNRDEARGVARQPGGILSRSVRDMS